MAIPNPIKWFTSNMQGAPQMASSFGQLIAVLDACLVDGFNTKTVTGITTSGGIATATVGASHGYVQEQVVLIAGCDQPEYNGDQRITSTTSTTISFAVTGTPADATTSTSITAKASPLGFQKAFAGTNKAAYRSQNVASPKNYLRVDNSQHASWVAGRAIVGKVTMGRSMSDVDTFTGDFFPYSTSQSSFPDWGWYTWPQSHGNGNSVSTPNNGASVTTWYIFGDDRCFYYMPAQGASSYTGRRLFGFGDIDSYKSGDQWGTFTWAYENYNCGGTAGDWQALYGPQCGVFGPFTNYAGQALLKGYTGIGSAVGVGKISMHTSTDITYGSSSGWSTGVAWPNGPDQSLVLHPSYAYENSAHLRGMWPGLYCIHNNVGSGIPDLQIVDNVIGYPGRKFIAVGLSPRADGTANSPLRIMFDLTGPWRYGY